MTMGFKHRLSITISKDDYEEKFNIRGKKHPLILLLKLSGLYFGEKKDSRFWYYFGIIRAWIICSICKL